MLLQSSAIFLPFLLLAKAGQNGGGTTPNVSLTATAANCFPSDPVKNPNSAFICEGDFIRLYSVDAKNQQQYLAIKNTPDDDQRHQSVQVNTGSSNATAFQIFPFAPQSPPYNWPNPDWPPSYVRDAMKTGHTYPFKLRDGGGRWLKISPGNYKDKKYQTLFVDNMDEVYADVRTGASMLLYVPNSVFTTRSSNAGGAPAGWILDASQGIVLFNYYQDHVVFDWDGPNPKHFPGCETLSAWTIEQTQSPTAYTGFVEQVLNIKYEYVRTDAALKSLVMSNEATPNIGNSSITNPGATEQNLILTMSTTQSNTWTFNRDQRYKFSTTAQAWVGVPFLGTGMSVSVSADMALTTGTGTSQTKSTYFSISAMIPVPGQSVVSGSIWMTKATMKKVPLTYTVQRTWPDGKVITFKVTDTVDVVQYYDAVVCISQALSINLGQTPACVPPAFSMWNSNSTD
ncbi:hypothetical protein SmJEL517_g01871 [Synchytrium microbalum]|uniref:Uncharacterized protein n=1 Tax=Synchytrium microbalum TaxID=1806994 RepID=A0A507CE28_9FUNG|nr:uncharacterized protein SmJEL517_g01871 [Synchytrium microbalum]TPX35773.1 hypothetical protein SmJEL517_g01871 [Synchytrium microbalum]